MPYIIMKRSDIPAGVLQVLDMDPNTSLRNYTLDVPGQTKYVDPVQNDEVVLMQPGGGGTPIIFRREASGLAAWIATNVNDGTGAFATGSFTILLGNAADGDTVSIDSTAVGGGLATLTFRAVPVLPTDVLIGGTEDATATNLAMVINSLASTSPYVTAVAPGGGPPSPVLLTATMEGTASNGILLASVGANLADSGGLAGGMDADALTAVEINGSATAILALYAFGDLTSAAGTLTLGDINGAMVAGAITAAQLTEVLDILAGRQYFVPNNTQIDADGTTFDVQPPVGTTGGPWFVPGSLRPLFLNDGLPLSFTQGELLGYTDSGFVYGGVAGNPNGEAVVVYNDDGTFFTP